MVNIVETIKDYKPVYEGHRTTWKYSVLLALFGSEYQTRIIWFSLLPWASKTLLNIEGSCNIYFKYRFNETNEHVRDKIRRVIENSRPKMEVMYEIINGLMDDTIVLHENLFYHFIDIGASISEEILSVMEQLLPDENEINY